MISRQCFPRFIPVIRFRTKGITARLLGMNSSLLGTETWVLAWGDLGEFQAPADEALAMLSELPQLSFLVYEWR